MYVKSKVKLARFSFECTNPLSDMILFAIHLCESRITAASVKFQNSTQKRYKKKTNMPSLLDVL